MEQLHQQRERIVDDLRGLVAGEVRSDDIYLQIYASDASVYEIRPLAVIRPRSVADVVACVQYAAGKGIPLHARGAGTGVAGESIGPGLVLDFSKYLRRIIDVDGETARVQPGVTHQRLNVQLRPLGRVFGPAPGTISSTIGGMIAVDAAGSHWLKYGSTRDHVGSLEVVLADGQLVQFGREPLSDDAAGPFQPRKRELVGRIATLLGENAELIRRHRPQRPLGHCGYNLSDILCDGHLDMARLLVGSEGTLALVTAATLATQPLARHRTVSLLLFDSLEKAARTVEQILPLEPAACDLMDRRHLSLARQSDPRLEAAIPAETEAALLVEREGNDPLDLRQWSCSLVEQICQQQRSAFAARQASDDEETSLFRQLVCNVRPALYGLKGLTRPVPVVEDVAVAPADLPDFLVRMQNVLKRHEITTSLLAHAGRGQLRIQPFLNLDDPADVDRMRRLADELYQEVVAVGGTLAGEHACGLSRTAYLRQQAGPLYDVFVALKRIFDPQGILNPGKIIGDDPDLLVRNLRPPMTAPASPAELRDLTELQMNWDPASVAEPAADCNRCGYCRTQSAELRMCPIFRFAPAEEASPRAKANLIRGVLSGRVELGRLGGDEFKEVADLCVHCHACRLECPAGVDIPRLMRQSKAAYVTVHGLRRPEWVMTHLDWLAGLASVMAPAANWAIENRFARWLLEKSLGIARGRKLPHVASRSFLRRAARRRLTRPVRREGPKVLYFVDLYANYFDPQLAQALVAVLEHNGVGVFVPAEQLPAGMPSIACGHLDRARHLARANIALLAEQVRQGYHIVASEPAAALCLTREYPQLIDDDDARLVAANSSEASTYLWRMHTEGHLNCNFQPVPMAVGYHLPCHLRALEVGSPGENLLRLIPGLKVTRLEEGCSGMAGTFGLLQQNYRNSLRAGRHLITRMRDERLQAGATECSACKLQMEQALARPTFHPLKLLAMAYKLLDLRPVAK
jgi:FAD/FMN-containing dehydrogenase/Fe-S oxidoreductase